MNFPFTQILRMSICYDLDMDAMHFSNGLCLSQEQIMKGGFGLLAPTLFSFAMSMKLMSCDETEYALLCSICLISGGEWIGNNFTDAFSSSCPACPETGFIQCYGSL